MQKYKICIVDDNRQTLTSLSDLITYSDEFDLVFTAKNGKDYLEQMENLDIISYPQLVLMDLEMPTMDGIQAMQVSRMKYPFVKYIVFTSFDDEDRIFKAIQAGAHGYLLKDEKVSVIRSHIKDLLNNQATPMSPSIAKKTFEILSKINTSQTTTSPSNNELFSSLSTREMEVLKLMEEGHNYKIIAEKLFISTNTVRTHIAHVYEKLHVSSKYQMLNLLKK
jgi:DNA-binding NarL/FixJ family response regulator